MEDDALSSSYAALCPSCARLSWPEMATETLRSALADARRSARAGGGGPDVPWRRNGRGHVSIASADPLESSEIVRDFGGCSPHALQGTHDKRNRG